METIRLATLLTCYNRKEATLDCLNALYSQTGIEDIKVNVYLVDAGCTDSTGEVVREQFPEVRILQGDENLYWCGGMRLAWAEAMKDDYDYYLWLNDDTLLFPSALHTLLDTSLILRTYKENQVIIVGSTCDAETQIRTYGGAKQKSWWQPLNFLPFDPDSEKPRICDIMNGNCVLIPRNIATEVGNLSEEFIHGLGDYDYCLRAKAKGYFSWVAPGYIGVCSMNPLVERIKDNTLPVEERLNMMNRITIRPPVKEWRIFVRHHGGFIWPIYWPRTLLRVYFPRLWLWVQTNRSN